MVEAGNKKASYITPCSSEIIIRYKLHLVLTCINVHLVCGHITDRAVCVHSFQLVKTEVQIVQDVNCYLFRYIVYEHTNNLYSYTENNWHYHRTPRCCFYTGRSKLGQWGVISSKPRPCSQMWHGTLFDELKVSAYRCKKKRSGIASRQNAFPTGVPPRPQFGKLTTLFRPSRLGMGHPSYPNLVGPPSALANSASQFGFPKYSPLEPRSLSAKNCTVQFVLVVGSALDTKTWQNSH